MKIICWSFENQRQQQVDVDETVRRIRIGNYDKVLAKLQQWPSQQQQLHRNHQSIL